MSLQLTRNFIFVRLVVAWKKFVFVINFRKTGRNFFLPSHNLILIIDGAGLRQFYLITFSFKSLSK